ncbi:glycosyltransferase [Aquimarina sp. SS2-1]|uniref:glycosyltransferase n=1 Tax=Aquimarina besae TaxID=3342247 RepID=UPI00366EA5F6
MNILITNNEMDSYTGTTVYVKELAIALVKRGENVQIYTRYVGEIGLDIQRKGIMVTDSLREITFMPDIIHTHHNTTVFDVLFYFKNTPVIFWIHDRLTPLDFPPLHKNIIRYLSVDYNCKERYSADCGFDPSDSEVIYNWVNLERFTLRKKLNQEPKKALVFSNYANNDNHLKSIQEACEQRGLQLDVIGKGTGNQKRDPEAYLMNYDIIFAKAKAAMESLASGAGVIICDYTGLAGFVTSDKLKHYRKYNFGMKLMDRLITKEYIIEEIKKYDLDDIFKVSKTIRSEIDMEKIINQIQSLYKDCITKYEKGDRGKYKFSLKNFLIIKIKTFYISNSQYLFYNFNSLFIFLHVIKKRLFP